MARSRLPSERLGEGTEPEKGPNPASLSTTPPRVPRFLSLPEHPRFHGDCARIPSSGGAARLLRAGLSALQPPLSPQGVSFPWPCARAFSLALSLPALTCLSPVACLPIPSSSPPFFSFLFFICLFTVLLSRGLVSILLSLSS